MGILDVDEELKPIPRLKLEHGPRYGGLVDERTRQEIEDALRRRFEEAKAVHAAARAEHKRLSNLVTDAGLGTPDSGVALRQAIELAKSAYEEALKTHHTALKEFTNLTVHRLDPRVKD